MALLRDLYATPGSQGFRAADRAFRWDTAGLRTTVTLLAQPYRRTRGPSAVPGLVGVGLRAALAIVLVLLGARRLRAHWAALSWLPRRWLVAVSGSRCPSGWRCRPRARCVLRAVPDHVDRGERAVDLQHDGGTGHFDVLQRSFARGRRTSARRPSSSRFCFGALLEALAVSARAGGDHLGDGWLALASSRSRPAVVALCDTAPVSPSGPWRSGDHAAQVPGCRWTRSPPRWAGRPVPRRCSCRWCWCSWSTVGVCVREAWCRRWSARRVRAVPVHHLELRLGARSPTRGRACRGAGRRRLTRLTRVRPGRPATRVAPRAAGTAARTRHPGRGPQAYLPYVSSSCVSRWPSCRGSQPALDAVNSPSSGRGGRRGHKRQAAQHHHVLAHRDHTAGTLLLIAGGRGRRARGGAARTVSTLGRTVAERAGRSSPWPRCWPWPT